MVQQSRTRLRLVEERTEDGGGRRNLSGTGVAGQESVSVVREDADDGELRLEVGNVSPRLRWESLAREASSFAWASCFLARSTHSTASASATAISCKAMRSAAVLDIRECGVEHCQVEHGLVESGVCGCVCVATRVLCHG